MDSFKPFSPMHALVVVAFAVLTSACVLLARRYRSSRGRLIVERIVGWSSLLLFAATNSELWLRSELFDPKRSLPLHVCDLSLLLVPAVLVFRWWPARVILYYFGLGLSTQGFFTPDLRVGPAHWGFWSFWLLHFAVIGTPIYDVAARGFRPGWREARLAMTTAVLYALILMPIDARFGWNYGYVGPSKPAQPSLIDVLGPWPWRVAIMTGMAMTVFALMTLPWTVSRATAGPEMGLQGGSDSLR